MTTKPTFTIPDALWNNIYEGQDGLAPRLRAFVELEVGDRTEKLSYVDIHLTAICVTDLPEIEWEQGRWQTAVNAEDTYDLDKLFEIEGKDGNFDTVTIGGAGDGRTFIIFATP